MIVAEYYQLNGEIDFPVILNKIVVHSVNSVIQDNTKDSTNPI